LKITSCRFDRAAFGRDDEPRGEGPDVVFVGRSNVGKSSLINRLLGTKDLARTSSTPGRTRSVNFYRVNDAIWFVDLPGYGYAKVSGEVRRSWGPMIEGVLRRRRPRIAIAVLVVDARQGPTELDRAMRDWLVGERIAFLAAATKADKLSGNGRARALPGLLQAFGETAFLRPLLVSASTGLGIRGVWEGLDRAIEGAKARSKGEAWTSES
jgi:GTP-binding protein